MENTTDITSPQTAGAPGSALVWSETWDDDDNSIWETCGPYTDECGGTEFMWRLVPKFRSNSVRWYNESDAELVIPGDEQSWASLDEAKTAIAKDHAECIAVCMKEAALHH